MPTPVRPVRLYAHRGASAEAPENTMPAFLRALGLAGVNALELDVHLTRDGHPIVCHDPTALRMANRKVAWKDVDLAEARTFDMGWGFVAPDGTRPFAGNGVRISTFQEVLTELPPIVLNVDLKQAWPPMAERMVRLIREHHAEDRVVLASFHLSALLAARVRGYAGPTALARGELLSLLGLPRRLLRRTPMLGTCAQVPEKAGPITFAKRAFIEKCHGLGMRVDFWTINNPHRARDLLDLGADGIMTDDPRALSPVFAPER